MNAITNLTPSQLRRAADIQEKLLGLQDELNSLLNVPSVGHSAGRSAPAGRKRRMSAAGRAAISAAAKARWASYRKVEPAPKNGRKKRKMSAAGRARLAAFARERWRKARAQGKSTL